MGERCACAPPDWRLASTGSQGHAAGRLRYQRPLLQIYGRGAPGQCMHGAAVLPCINEMEPAQARPHTATSIPSLRNCPFNGGFGSSTPNIVLSRTLSSASGVAPCATMSTNFTARRPARICRCGEAIKRPDVRRHHAMLTDMAAQGIRFVARIPHRTGRSGSAWHRRTCRWLPPGQSPFAGDAVPPSA